MSKAVVDYLEVVDVQEGHGQHLVLPSAARQRVVDSICEQGAVGQSGQLVVKNLALEFDLQSNVVGDIVDNGDEGRTSLESTSATSTSTSRTAPSLVRWRMA